MAAKKQKTTIQSMRIKKDKKGRLIATIKTGPVKKTKKAANPAAMKVQGSPPPGQYKGTVKTNASGHLVVDVDATPPDQLVSTMATALTKKDSVSSLTNDSVITGASKVLAEVSLVQVTSQDEAINAGRMLVQLKGMVTQVEDRRKFFTRPLKEHVARIEALFKPTVDKLKEADQMLRQKVVLYTAEQAKKAREEQQKLLTEAQEAQAAGDNETALALATVAQDVATPEKKMLLDTGGSVTTKKVWTFKVVDAGAVPDEYYELSEAKIRMAVRAGAREIPGVEIFQQESLAVGIGSGDL